MPLTTSIRVRATSVDAASRKFSKLGRSVDAVGRRGSRLNKVLGGSLRGATGAFRGLAGAAAGLGAVLGVREIANTQEALARLRIDAKLSADEITRLEGAIGAAAKRGVGEDEALRGLRVWQDFGGQLKLGIDIFDELARVSRLTGSDIAETSNLVATLAKNLQLNKAEALDSIAVLKEIGDQANISLTTSAKVLPRILANANKAGFRGGDAAKQLFGSFQVIAGNLGSGPDAASRGATQLDALLRQLVSQRKKLSGAGVQTFRADGGLRDLTDIMADVLRTTGGDIRKISKLFTEQEALQAVIAFQDAADPSKLKGLATSVQRTNVNFGTLNKQFKQFEQQAGGAQKLRQTTAQLEQKFKAVGIQMLNFAAENPLGTIAGVIGGKLVLGGLAQASGQVIGALAGKAGLVGAVGATTFALGTMADNWLGLSDKISDAAISLDKTLGPSDRTRQLVTKATTGKANLQALATRLVGLRRQGVSSVQTDQGRQALTNETILQILQANAGKQGLNAEGMRPLLVKMLAALEKPLVVRGGGVDAAAVQVSRGGAS